MYDNIDSDASSVGYGKFRMALLSVYTNHARNLITLLDFIYENIPQISVLPEQSLILCLGIEGLDLSSLFLTPKHVFEKFKITIF